MFVLLGFAFLAGFVTILAPCIWPLLPIVLSVSSGQGKQRSLGITLGVLSSFSLLTLSISYLEKFLHLDPDIFRLVAVIVIILLGLSMLFPAAGTLLENLINRLLGPFQSKFQKQGNGFWGGYGAGFSIGLVWAPCAGPILAAIATLAATQAITSKVVMVTLAYVTGLGIPLFLFSLAGAKFFGRLRQINKMTGLIQQIFGAIMIIAALLIYSNYDKAIQVKLLEIFPSYGSFLNSIENNDKVTKELIELEPSTASAIQMAPEFTGITQWLNSEPLTMAQLKGKVVLVDFWTYSCINCIRTLPHLTSWYEKYKNNNFVIVGVHTPEFAFEKKTSNVKRALADFKIRYPVALDNSFSTWSAYKNRYWPAKYLIDTQGKVRYTHFGEGQYDQTERMIRYLLMEAGEKLTRDMQVKADQTPRFIRTPETYMGQARAERFSSYEPLVVGMTNFSHPRNLPLNHFAYEGIWEITKEAGRAKGSAALEFHIRASKVFLVMSPSMMGDRVKVLLDGEPVKEYAGQDVKDGYVILDEERLYNLVDLKGKVEKHMLRLEFENEGIAVYAFTFG